MADLKCKCCGNRFVMGGYCPSSETKKHIALSNGKDCVYCGNRFAQNGYCMNSPDKKHKLQD